MKRYRITKIVFANNIQEIMDIEIGGEITDIELKDDIKEPNQIGFIKENGNR